MNYLSNILSRYEAGRKGFDDAILVNAEGFVAKATSSNVFLVKRGKIFTSSLECGILPGITRSEVIRLAAAFLKKKVRCAFMRRRDLYNADEVFLTNSLAEIIPVVKVDKRTAKYLITSKAISIRIPINM